MVEETGAWNMLVTAQEGFARDLLRELKRRGRFRWSTFRNVVIGSVEDQEAFLQSLVELLDQKPFVAAWLGKALPIDATFAVEVDSFVADAEACLLSYIDQVGNRSFHVRVERRGPKGRLRTEELER